ncbi:MAG TPA: FAD-binding oxidoreductase [Stellaceae bacterium]|nr:FAD-binding oxidoreductase [Stellaceae bacterium]
MHPDNPRPDDLRDAVAAIVGAAHVLTTAADLAAYVTDWRDRYHGDARMVVRPASAAEVSAVVRLCFEHGVPVVPQGGNTGLCGGATPDASGQAVVLRLDRMNRIRDISVMDGTMLVEAGCILQTLQEAAAAAGLLFPLSLGAEGSCQIGGNISTNAGGTAVLRYGPTRDLVLGLEVVLPDGSLCDWLTPLRKNTTGYDLKQLFIGAEGTLGIITAAALKVFPQPAQSTTAMVTLEGPEAALTLLERLRTTLGDRLSSFEIINWAQAEIALTYVPGNTLPFAGVSPWYVVVEVTDTLTRYDLREALESVLAGTLEDGTITDAVVASSEAQAAALWRIRHSVSEGNKHAGFGVSHDTAVPLRAQADFVRRVEQRIPAEFPDGKLLLVGHMGDGNIHVVVLFDQARHTSDVLQRIATRVNAIVDEITLDLRGTISAEHGIGQTNKQRLLAGRGPHDVALMRRIKAALDPKGLFNPGKLFDPPDQPSAPDLLH